MNTSNISFGIKGEPQKGIIYHDAEEDITLRYDPNVQIISFMSGDILYDHVDCSYYNDWESVLQELRNEFGIELPPL